MTRIAVDQAVYFLDQSFDGERAQSLIANLESVSDEDWDWVPPRGARSIAAIAAHIAGAMFMWENHAFGDRTLTWEDPRWSQPRSKAEMVGWMREGYSLFRARVSALTDDELLEQRPTHWGGTGETRRVIASIIEHNAYHGGEINHIRALHHGDDAWSW
jgi:uncharacterized damage-inducible protein DinB